MLNNYESLKEKANALKNNRLANMHRTSNGIYSVNMVNNKNGKRISFSKMLSMKLGLQDIIDIVAFEDDGVILISKNLPHDDKSTFGLRGDDKKIIYNAELVETLTEIFNLDFSTKTSRSFTDISINADDAEPMAEVRITKPSQHIES